MAFNAFVNFGSNIKGECTDKDHKDWVMIQSYYHEIAQPPSVTQKTAGGRSAEAVTHSEYCVVKLLDAASPKLFEAACKGTHIPEVTIELVRAGGDSPVTYMSTKLKEVLISGVTHNGDPTGNAQFPTETVKMTYGAIELTYTKQGADGKAAGNIATKWNVAQGAAA
jgi:type VI secretion system secreted protein Hcp